MPTMTCGTSLKISISVLANNQYKFSVADLIKKTKNKIQLFQQITCLQGQTYCGKCTEMSSKTVLQCPRLADASKHKQYGTQFIVKLWVFLFFFFIHKPKTVFQQVGSSPHKVIL